MPALAQLFRGWPGQASTVNQKAQQSPGTEAGAGPASSATDTAALQLEALQVLLLLFPLPFPQVSLRTHIMLAWVEYTNAASPIFFLHKADSPYCAHPGAYCWSGCVLLMLGNNPPVIHFLVVIKAVVSAC